MNSSRLAVSIDFRVLTNLMLADIECHADWSIIHAAVKKYTQTNGAGFLFHEACFQKQQLNEMLQFLVKAPCCYDQIRFNSVG